VSTERESLEKREWVWEDVSATEWKPRERRFVVLSVKHRGREKKTVLRESLPVEDRGVSLNDFSLGYWPWNKGVLRRERASLISLFFLDFATAQKRRELERIEESYSRKNNRERRREWTLVVPLFYTELGGQDLLDQNWSKGCKPDRGQQACDERGAASGGEVSVFGQSLR
jgi:hypothetical protein